MGFAGQKSVKDDLFLKNPIKIIIKYIILFLMLDLWIQLLHHGYMSQIYMSKNMTILKHDWTMLDKHIKLVLLNPGSEKKVRGMLDKTQTWSILNKYFQLLKQSNMLVVCNYHWSF